MPAFLASLLSGIPGLASKAIDLALTYTGLKNTPVIDQNKTGQLLSKDDAANADVVDKAIESGDVTDLQKKGGIR